MKKLLNMALACMMVFTLAACGKKEEVKKPEVNTKIKYEEYLNDTNPVVEIKFKDFGTIELQLFEEVAPNTVRNFLDLVRNKFYDGLTMHRIIKDFMIQGGDPEGSGIGGSDNIIEGEFKINGIDNPLSHTRGVISMARSNDPNSASSQFFIVHQDSVYLDGQYASFGGVTKGFDVLDEIANVKTKVNDMPETPVVIESIKITREAKEVKAPVYYDYDLMNSNEGKPLFIHDDNNPEAIVNLANGKSFTIELFPKDNKPAVDQFIELVNKAYYNNLELKNVQNLFSQIMGDTNEVNYVIQDGVNNFKAYKGSVGFRRIQDSQNVLLNSSNSILVILDNFLQYGEVNFNLFGFIFEGLDNYLEAAKNATSITTIDLNLNGYTPSITEKYSLTFNPSDDYLKETNPHVEIELTTGDKFTIELFIDEAKESVANFLSLNLVGLNIAEIFKDQFIRFNEMNTGEVVEADVILNGVHNNISNDKYTLMTFIPTLYSGTDFAFVINLNDNHHFDARFGVFAKVVEGTEVIDKLAKTETTETGLLTTPIKITKVTVK